MTVKIEQEETTRISVERIMATEAFRRGVRDVRLGRVRFDEEASGPSHGWFYEKGRMFGVIAPRDLEVVLNERLNPEAITFYKFHCFLSRDIL